MNAARLTIWDDDACRRVHEATLEVLAETGIEVQLRAGRRALRQGRRAGRRHARAHPGRAGRGRHQERAARLDDQAARRRHRAARPRRRAHATAAPGCDVLYVCDPDTRERRRVRRADVEGMAALCEKLPNIDFVMSMGLPEDAPQAIDDLVQVDAMVRGTRKPLLVAPRDGHILGEDEGDGGAGRRGRQLRHLRHAGAAAAVRRGRRQQGDRLRRARHPADLGAGAERRHHGAGEHRVRDRRRQRRGARRPRAEPGGQAGRAVRLGRRRRRDEHADDERGVLVGGRLPRPPGADRPGALVRPAELRLRGAHRQQDARRAVERRGGAHGDPRQALARRRCCTTSATSSAACRAATSRSSSATTCSAGPRRSWRRWRWTTRRWRWTRSRRWGRAATTWPGPTRASTSGRSGRATCFDTTRHDAWEADGSQTLLDRLRARVAELRSEPRAFELPDDVKAGLDRDPRGRRGAPARHVSGGKNRCTCGTPAARSGFPRARAVIDSGPCPTHPASASARSTAPAVSKPSASADGLLLSNTATARPLPTPP